MGSNPSRLRQQVLYELAENTKFSENEIREWYKQFTQDYPNAYASLKQFRDAYAQRFSNPSTLNFTLHIHTCADPENGMKHLMDFAEFLIATSVTAQASPRRRLAWAFSMFDEYEEGYISKENVKHIIDAIFHLQSHPGSIMMDYTAEECVDAVCKQKGGAKKSHVTESELIDGVLGVSGLVKLLQQDQLTGSTGTSSEQDSTMASTSCAAEAAAATASDVTVYVTPTKY